MKILTGRQMARWDWLSIHRHGVSARRLMSQAAARCGELLLEHGAPKKSSRIVIVCGPGNNGGDGFALALWLVKRGFDPRLFFLGDKENLSREARDFHDALAQRILPLRISRDLATFRKSLAAAHFVVDAIFGIGLKRPLRGIFKSAIDAMNHGRAFKLAIDIPSGLSADTGKVLAVAFRADLTVTFETPKWGHILEPAWEYVGALEVRPIGLSASELRKFKSEAQWVDASLVAPWFHRRKKNTHKGSAGEVLVIAGSSRMPGAGYLCATAALRAGAGLVRWALPKTAAVLNLDFPEVILLPVASAQGVFGPKSVHALLPYTSQAKACAFGPGIGQKPETSQFIEAWLQQGFRPMVLDADALNLLASRPKLLKRIEGCILTPHPKEMARLLRTKPRTVLQSRIRLARTFAKQYGVWLILKGYRSVIAGPKGQVYLNSSGGPNLATAGSGDILTGILAGLLAQGFSTEHAVVAGTYLHGRAGDLLYAKLGDRGTLASDIGKTIPLAIRELLRQGARI